MKNRNQQLANIGGKILTSIPNLADHIHGGIGNDGSIGSASNDTVVNTSIDGNRVRLSCPGCDKEYSIQKLIRGVVAGSVIIKDDDTIYCNTGCEERHKVYKTVKAI